MADLQNAPFFTTQGISAALIAGTQDQGRNCRPKGLPKGATTFEQACGRAESVAGTARVSRGISSALADSPNSEYVACARERAVWHHPRSEAVALPCWLKAHRFQQCCTELPAPSS